MPRRSRCPPRWQPASDLSTSCGVTSGSELSHWRPSCEREPALDFVVLQPAAEMLARRQAGPRWPDPAARAFVSWFDAPALDPRHRVDELFASFAQARVGRKEWNREHARDL